MRGVFAMGLILGILAAGCSKPDEEVKPVTERPANFKGKEAASQGGGAAATSDARPGAAPPPGG